MNRTLRHSRLNRHSHAIQANSPRITWNKRDITKHIGSRISNIDNISGIPFEVNDKDIMIDIMKALRHGRSLK